MTTNAHRRVGTVPWFLAPACLLVAMASGCDLQLSQATATYHDVITTTAAPKIIVETFNGSIDISNGMDNEVVAEVTARASGVSEVQAAENLNRIDVLIAQISNDEIHVRAKRIGRIHGESGADVVIAVPANSQVELKSSNSYIVSEGLRASVTAETSNARIEVVDASGRIRAETSNAPIQIEATGAEVTADTSNAAIRFEGTLGPGNHKLETSNGPIDVRLPADSQFRYAARTSNGEVDVEFADRIEKAHRRSRKSGTVGDNPQFSLELETSNSSIRIRQDD
jgi:DUF4097 and DUF4098 domain-containing protein YvlB